MLYKNWNDFVSNLEELLQSSFQLSLTLLVRHAFNQFSISKFLISMFVWKEFLQSSFQLSLTLLVLNFRLILNKGTSKIWKWWIQRIPSEFFSTFPHVICKVHPDMKLLHSSWELRLILSFLQSSFLTLDLMYSWLVFLRISTPSGFSQPFWLRHSLLGKLEPDISNHNLDERSIFLILYFMIVFVNICNSTCKFYCNNHFLN